MEEQITRVWRELRVSLSTPKPWFGPPQPCQGLPTLTALLDGPLTTSASGSLDPVEAPERVGGPGSHELRPRAERTSLEESV